MNKWDYDNGVLKISDWSKFKALEEDPTLLRGQLQWDLRELKAKGHLDSDVYCNIYPSGSQPAKIYELPKMH